MAKFEGTVTEFMKFIGGYARNKVQYLTVSYRKSMGRCEACGYRGKKLEAAHLHGNERPFIISQILQELNHSEEEGIVSIDLQEFEARFVEFHSPIENVIRTLCHQCHRDYDKKISLPEEEEDVDEELQQEEERDLEEVKSLLVVDALSKREAIKLSESALGEKLTNKNTIYSNVNKTQNVWWLEPTFDRLAQDFYMLLNNSEEHCLLVFHLPAGTISNIKEMFVQRSDKGDVAKFIIPVSGTKYVDRKGFDFTSYLVQKITY